MKKFLYILCAALIFASCNGAGYLSPHEERTLTVINNSGLAVPLKIKARYNSRVYFDGSLATGETKTFTTVLCETPELNYTINLDISGNNSPSTTWTISKANKVDCLITNSLAIKVQISGKKDDNKITEKDIDPGASITVGKYPIPYDWTLKEQKSDDFGTYISPSSSVKYYFTITEIGNTVKIQLK